MNYQSFLDWLIIDKKMSARSAKDVISRVKRVLKVLNIDVLTSSSCSDLVSSPWFISQSMFIKAQLKRSVVLYFEFSESE